MISFLIAAILFETSQFGIGLKVESETKVIDPARSVFLTMELRTPHDRTAQMPDLRDRVVGFSLVEDFAEEPRKEKDGSTVQVTNWRLVPEPCAEVYKIKPFVVKGSPKIWKAQSDEGKFSFIGGPIYFENPAAREPVTGGMETDDRKDRWAGFQSIVKAFGGVIVCLLIVCLILLLILVVILKAYLYFGSPIKKARVELNRLVKENLPGRGFYKEFYVELTMVVRRYVQRKYGIMAPHLTTEEFFSEIIKSNNRATLDKHTTGKSNKFIRFNPTSIRWYLQLEYGDKMPSFSQRYLLPRYVDKASHFTIEDAIIDIARSKNLVIGFSDGLRRFLDSADIVKFAGVAATLEMTEEATDAAWKYLENDSGVRGLRRESRSRRKEA